MPGSPLQAVGAANPGFRLDGAPPAPQPGAGFTRVQTVRAQQPGGKLAEFIQSENILWFEQLYRKLPPNGMFGASPNKPVVFTMGSFKVPQTMVLVIIDYAFDIYRFSGAAAGDFVPIEENRLSTQVGWDIKVNNDRPANVNFQIIPQQQTQSQQTFATIRAGVPAQDWQFDEQRALQGQGPAGPALSMMPQRRFRPGRTEVANSYVAQPASVLNVTVSIINTIPIPIAFFEADVCGMLLPQHVYEAYQKAAVPIGSPIQNPIPGGT